VQVQVQVQVQREVVEEVQVRAADSEAQAPAQDLVLSKVSQGTVWNGKVYPRWKALEPLQLQHRPPVPEPLLLVLLLVPAQEQDHQWELQEAVYRHNSSNNELDRL
jgi:hypothetical protein